MYVISAPENCIFAGTWLTPALNEPSGEFSTAALAPQRERSSKDIISGADQSHYYIYKYKYNKYKYNNDKYNNDKYSNDKYNK